MKRTRLVSIDSDAEKGDAGPAPETRETAIPEGEQALPAEEEIIEYEYEDEPVKIRSGWVVPTFALLAIAAWTAFFAWAHRTELVGAAPLQWIEWVGDWAPPVVIVALLWLLAMRTSRREARRFTEAAQALRLESEQLEARLHHVNGELSVAREFLSSQARELDTLGRMAADKIGEHSERLQTLIAENGAEVDRISTVSSSALENMESIRGNLPVITSSTKDMTNTIAQAGLTAQNQLDEMVAGLKRVNEFGEASEAQIESLRMRIGEAFEEFATSVQQTGEGLADRYKHLNDSVVDSRARFDAEEVQALAAMRDRWSVLGEDIRVAITELSSLDDDVIAPAGGRIAAMREEHEALLGDAARANEEFDAEMGRRREAFDIDQQAAVERLRERLDTLDAELGARRDAQAERAEEIVALTDDLTSRIERMGETASQSSELGRLAGETLDHALATAAERLAATGQTVRDTDALLDNLTDTTVRLLELVRATADHGAADLPKALTESEQSLVLLEDRAARLAESVAAAGASGSALSQDLGASHERLSVLMDEFERAASTIDQGTGGQQERIAAIATEFDALREKSEALAAHARDELAASIDALREANAAALAQIESDGGEGLTRWAQKLGEASGEAIDRALEARIDVTATKLDEATDRAALNSREATVQLRDQLAKIDELTGNLERRVAYARQRAQEQVDNDFSRRAALITESLNSAAIDIAKALSAEVTDTAWASYLKGDRGIFTRRAVSLLDNSEAREIGALYRDDESFRDDVSRYIHDFEGMLRQLLSTRDGHALGVTLLSSDMGKLYVALAQGIERIRS